MWTNITATEEFIYRHAWFDILVQCTLKCTHHCSDHSVLLPSWLEICVYSLYKKKIEKIQCELSRLNDFLSARQNLSSTQHHDVTYQKKNLSPVVSLSTILKYSVLNSNLILNLMLCGCNKFSFLWISTCLKLMWAFPWCIVYFLRSYWSIFRGKWWGGGGRHRMLVQMGGCYVQNLLILSL